MYLARDLVEFTREHRAVTYPLGSAGDYRSVHTQLLGHALARVEGRPLLDLLGKRLWGPMGAENTVIVKLSDHGDEQDEQETFEALRAIAGWRRE